MTTSSANDAPTPTVTRAAPSAPTTSMPSSGEGISVTARWPPTARCPPTTSASTVSTTRAPITVSTHHKARGVKIASRSARVSSRHTATSATCTQPTPAIAAVPYGTWSGA
jgi:hypothetical protein